MMRKPAGVALLALLLLPLAAQGETRYVTDSLEINLRTGQSTGHRIIRTLDSGTPVEVLDSDAESGYSRIRIGSREGYVLTRHLMDQPSARDRLEAMRAELEALKAKPGALRATLANLQEEHSELQQVYSALKAAKSAQDAELERIRRAAANAIRIANERDRLREQAAMLGRQVEMLEQDNRTLSSRARRDWFVAGAGVILGGMVIGLILPHLRLQRRKSAWDSL